MTETPRSPSILLHSPPSSSRSSLSNDRSLPRRNRAALRDYYKLKAANGSADTPPAQPQDEPAEVTHELDKADFDAQAYVDGLLAKEPLDKILRVEAGLVGAIRGLDGDRKALVYDNYSKLIDATDTIRRMRTSMEPLAPITSTLTPALASIADTSKELSGSLDRHAASDDQNDKSRKGAEVTPTSPTVTTVKWVLAAPQRIRYLLRDGKREDAELDWAQVKMLLDTWEGVDGVEALRRQGTEALKDG